MFPLGEEVGEQRMRGCVGLAVGHASEGGVVVVVVSEAKQALARLAGGWET